MFVDIKQEILNNARELKEKNDIITFLNYIKDAGITYSENDNGVFINLNSLNKKALYKINEKLKEVIKN